ncbi:hypothetical protein LCGC14_1552970 [marine sediment metagenome]|uniref:Methyltransferase type 11 domain-containing protein n=1 Tax=marine sediment metagenome TaxID=412755 RepID=A0A0F9L5V7_9ZZZZ
MKTVKLNLGSGNCPIDGYENVEIKNGQKAYPLDYEDESIDEIRAAHILEHFGRGETLDVLKDWTRKLKPTGTLKIAVPDFAKIVDEYKSGEPQAVGHLCGGQVDEHDLHKNIFDRRSLTSLLEKVGLVDIKHWDSKVKDCSSLPVSLNLQGTKPNGNPEIQEILDGFTAKKSNKYSQYGEDGITEAIFERIGAEERWVLEVGASDGILFSNSRQYVEQGWHAILIESEKLAYERLVDNCKDYPNAIPVRGEVGVDFTLDEILSKHNAPKHLDLMIIDIDGQDYHVWNAMMDYSPRVMIAEYNPKAESEYIPKHGTPSTDHQLDQAGQTAMIRMGSSKGYCACITTPVNIIMLHSSIFEATKDHEDIAGSNIRCNVPHTEHVPAVNPDEEEQVTVSASITAIMSAPRIGFVNNLMIAAKTLVPLGIQIEVGYGVFWGQILSRMFQEQIDKGIEWIVTLDYDSYYLREHFLTLARLMGEYPEKDCIMPIQIKREEDTILAGVNDTAKANCEYDATTDLIPVDTGHFGCTFFRLSAFEKLKKPWFLPIPDKDGGWGDGRVDEDMYFWKNWRESGNNISLTPQVSIGHMQLMITWPGKFERGSKPVHQYLNNVEKKGIPEHCKVSKDYIPKQIKN